MFRKTAEEQTARFLVVSKHPAGMVWAPNSAVSPTLLDPDKLFRVVLRFDPPREHHHPDDNDLELSCSPALHQALTEGQQGIGTWQGKHLLSFEDCE